MRFTPRLIAVNCGDSVINRDEKNESFDSPRKSKTNSVPFKVLACLVSGVLLSRSSVFIVQNLTLARSPFPFLPPPQPTLITRTSAWTASTPCPPRRGSLTCASTAGPARPAWPARCRAWPTPTPPPTSPPVSRRSASPPPFSHSHIAALTLSFHPSEPPRYPSTRHPDPLSSQTRG